MYADTTYSFIWFFTFTSFPNAIDIFVSFSLYANVRVSSSSLTPRYFLLATVRAHSRAPASQHTLAELPPGPIHEIGAWCAAESLLERPSEVSWKRCAAAFRSTTDSSLVGRVRVAQPVIFNLSSIELVAVAFCVASSVSVAALSAFTWFAQIVLLRSSQFSFSGLAAIRLSQLIHV